MSIATEITRIQQAKADIKTAIEAKGVTIPSSATIDTYDDYVSQISTSGGSYETRYTSGSTYCNGQNLMVDVTKQISVDGGTSWIVSGSPTPTLVESGSSQCSTPELQWVDADDTFNLSTPVYNVECMDLNPDTNDCLAYFNDGYSYYVDGNTSIAYLRLSSGGTTTIVAQNNVSFEIDIYAAIGRPLYLQSRPTYTGCLEWWCPPGCEECVSWWDSESDQCVDWDTGEGCCENQCNCPDECLNEETIYQCKVKVPQS